jgi:hypothetical protein
MSSMVFVAGFVVACGVLLAGVYLFARSDELDAAHVARARARESRAPDAAVTPPPDASGYSAPARGATHVAAGAEPTPLAGH